MAEISRIHPPYPQDILQEEEEDEDEEDYDDDENGEYAEESQFASVSIPAFIANMNTYTFNFNPFSPLDSSFCIASSDSSSSDDSASESDDFSDHEDEFYGHEEEEDGMSFVTDLFRSGEREYPPDSSVTVSGDQNEDDLGLGLGLEFVVGGLRVVGLGSDSDPDEEEEDEDDANSGAAGDSDSSDFCDCPRFDEVEEEEEVDLEEVNARVVVDDHDGLSSVINRIEEISISSEISSEGSDEDAARSTLEWEILLAVNNLERNLELEIDEEGEGFIYTAEFDALIGQFVESVRALKGSPPAAKSVVDNLPLVMLDEEDVVENQASCAVCKDGISMEEKVMRLPCHHYYHVECITPWLGIRNTCPLCRFELPTDDVDYERLKNEQSEELQIGYNFDLPF